MGWHVHPPNEPSSRVPARPHQAGRRPDMRAVATTRGRAPGVSRWRARVLRSLRRSRASWEPNGRAPGPPSVRRRTSIRLRAPRRPRRPWAGLRAGFLIGAWPDTARRVPVGGSERGPDRPVRDRGSHADPDPLRRASAKVGTTRPGLEQPSPKGRIRPYEQVRRAEAPRGRGEAPPPEIESGPLEEGADPYVGPGRDLFLHVDRPAGRRPCRGETVSMDANFRRMARHGSRPQRPSRVWGFRFTQRGDSCDRDYFRRRVSCAHSRKRSAFRAVARASLAS